ncbi:uncharacterized protein COLE_05911 [Cutaneotrichosporon oleaginosum]|nr:hypothetical protein COLE_05911 [Cutaneotrichosporon oleaginosum]
MLSKAGLTQSGKKEDLIKRLLDAGITGNDPEELVDPDVPALAPAVQAPAASASVAPASTLAAEPAGSAPAAAVVPAAPPSGVSSAPDAPPAIEDEPKEDELTEEEKKQKARAERFGIPWVRQKKTAAIPAATTPPGEKPAAQPKAEQEKPAKPAAIDATPLGISPEVLARRAAKFGLPEKKSSPVKSPAKEETKELSTEEAARLAEEEEKKRKRAEKFGVATNGSNEPNVKKVKV